MQINKTDQNDAEGLAQIMRTAGIGLCMSNHSTPTEPGPCLAHERSSSA